MTAPARVGGPAPHDPAHEKHERDRARRRSAAAERAYARRAQRAQNLRGTPAPQRQIAPKAPFVLMVMVVLGVGLAAIMYLSTQAAADTYRLQEARAEAERLTLQVEQLRQDVALLESPVELAKRASELGLVKPPDPARLRQNDDGSVEVYGKPSAAPKPAPPPSPTPPPQDQAGQPQQGQGQQQDQAQQGQTQQGGDAVQGQQAGDAVPGQQGQQPPPQRQGGNEPQAPGGQ